MGKHNSLREGARLGLVVATSIWVWLAVVDAVAGEPFRTFNVLGGIALFTAMHYLLNLAYGMVIFSAIHGAAREPSLVMTVAFGFPIVEFWFALVTVLLSHLGLDRKSTRLNSSHPSISYAVFCLKKKNIQYTLILESSDAGKDVD